MATRTCEGHPFRSTGNTYEIRVKDGMVAVACSYVPASEEERQALNEAMRTTGFVTLGFDGVRIVGLVL